MAQKRPADITPLPRSERTPRRKVFVRGLMIDAHIGAYAHEQGRPQPIRIDFELDVLEPADPAGDRLEDVVCYNRLTEGIRAILDEGHIRLVETLAERIADLALANPLVLAVSVRVEKPNAIPEADAAGAEIHRSKA